LIAIIEDEKGGKEREIPYIVL